MVDQIIHSSLPERLKEVNDIIDTCSDSMMTFEQANVIARFYFDYQDTNALIDEAEKLATEDTGRLRELAVSLKDASATLLDNIGKLDSVDFRAIAQAHSKKYYSRFQEASERLNPYWKGYSELNNRLDYLPLGSKEYAEIEKECEKAKAEHDTRQIEVRKLYAEYEKVVMNHDKRHTGKTDGMLLYARTQEEIQPDGHVKLHDGNILYYRNLDLTRTLKKLG